MPTWPDGVGPDDELERLACEFAESLNARLMATLDHVPPMVAEVQGAKLPRVFIRHVDPDRPGDPDRVAAIPLSIGGRHLLDFRITMRATWDRRGAYLTLAQSEFVVETTGGGRKPPLWRYEYDRHKTDSLPAAHLQLHAHRDEVVYLMLRGDRHRAGRRPDAMTTLDKIHFPVGGHRFRPCVEDVLEFTINEFGVDSVRPGWRQALAEGRADWRRKQLAAAVRDAPEVAANTLRELGFTVEPPDAGAPPEDFGRLSAL